MPITKNPHSLPRPQHHESTLMCARIVQGYRQLRLSRVGVKPARGHRNNLRSIERNGLTPRSAQRCALHRVLIPGSFPWHQARLCKVRDTSAPLSLGRSHTARSRYIPSNLDTRCPATRPTYLTLTTLTLYDAHTYLNIVVLPVPTSPDTEHERAHRREQAIDDKVALIEA